MPDWSPARPQARRSCAVMEITQSWCLRNVGIPKRMVSFDQPDPLREAVFLLLAVNKNGDPKAAINIVIDNYTFRFRATRNAPRAAKPNPINASVLGSGTETLSTAICSHPFARSPELSHPCWLAAASTDVDISNITKATSVFIPSSLCLQEFGNIAIIEYANVKPDKIKPLW